MMAKTQQLQAAREILSYLCRLTVEKLLQFLARLPYAAANYVSLIFPSELAARNEQEGP